MSEKNRISHTLPNGYMLEEFEIEDVLGIGGFGITYRAMDTLLKRAVAIKEYMPSGIAVRDREQASIMPASSAHQEDFDWGLERFKMEAATLVAFSHPNIVSVFRFFQANGTAYLVMEYQDGKSLAELLGKNGTLTETEINEILYPLLDGLEEVHVAGFMHRDIKPANIFIRRDGKPVLIDFGAARQAMGGHSQALTSIVTAGYAPYEQYESETVQGPWTDIYALGATLYRAIAGNKPVEAPKRAGAVMRGADDPNPPAREIGAGRYSPTLLLAIDTALNVLEGQRPQSVDEFKAFLAGEAESEAHTEVTYPSQQAGQEGATILAGGPASRAPSSSAVAGSATAAAIAAQQATGMPGGQTARTASTGPGAGVVAPAAYAAQPATTGDAGGGKKRTGMWIAVGVGVCIVLGGAGAGAWFYIDKNQKEVAARKAAEERQRLEAARQAEEARRKAEAARQQAAEAARRAAEAKKKAEEERRRQEAARRGLVEPGGEDQDTSTKNIGDPAPILGVWCSLRSRVTFTRATVFMMNTKSNWSQTYQIVRYEMGATQVQVHFKGADANMQRAIFIFQRTANNSRQMYLRRAFFGGKWRNYNTSYSRKC